MAMVNPTPFSNSNQAQKQTYSLNSTDVSNNRPREVSFSSFLNPAEEAFVHKLVQPGRSLSFNAEPEADHFHDLGHKEEDGEIGVFEAEKYFNGEIDREESPKSTMPSKRLIHLEHKKDEKEGEQSKDNIVVEPVRPRLHLGTPSIRSESSLNSQRALLRNISGKPSRKWGHKVNSSRSLLAAIGCKCSCSDKGSVEVADDEKNTTNFSSSVNGKPSTSAVGAFPANKNAPMSEPWLGEEIQARKSGKFGNFASSTCFDLPSLKPGDEELKPRKSLEVFGSPSFGKEENSKVTNDIESDASSELFEIESLTGKVNSYLTRETSDARSDCCPTPTTARYAPSEASIEWSVVTASAADFSVLSDSEEAAQGSGQTRNGVEAVSRRRPRPGILLGCKSQKAVQVAVEAHRTSSERFRLDPRIDSGRRSDLSANPVARFQAETKFMGFDHKHGKHASHLLYVGK